MFENLDPHHIIRELEVMTGLQITPGKTLLFLDEIQNCPKAIVALRYFKEKMPELALISAGSLLEFTLKEEQFSFPVGRVQFMYMKPLSFREFLLAMGQDKSVDYLDQITLNQPPSEVIHQEMLRWVRQYFLVGGMPASILSYIEKNSFLECQRVQLLLLQTFRSDFGKYATKAQHKYLELLFERAPRVVADHFKFSSIDAEARSRDLKVALEQLCFAGLIHRIHASSGSGIPLHAELKDNKFKLLFLDIGLMKAAMGLDLTFSDIMDLVQIDQGALAEQFVGQELLAYSSVYEDKKLYFWEREKKTSSAQVDYLLQVGSNIIPVEVKAGKTGSLRSLFQFVNEKKSPFGIRIAAHPLEWNNQVLSLPFYLIEQLPKLLREFPT